MAILKHSLDDHHLVDQDEVQVGIAELPAVQTVEERRVKRMAALTKAAGIWADRSDIPADGLEYQRQLRSEWRA